MCGFETKKGSEFVTVTYDNSLRLIPRFNDGSCLIKAFLSLIDQTMS